MGVVGGGAGFRCIVGVAGGWGQGWILVHCRHGWREGAGLEDRLGGGWNGQGNNPNITRVGMKQRYI